MTVLLLCLAAVAYLIPCAIVLWLERRIEKLERKRPA